jgi:hypothetical protein
MTREFRDHEQETQSIGGAELELAADHSRDAARRSSIVGLEREAAKSGLPPDVLHTKNGQMPGRQIAVNRFDRHDQQSEKARKAGFRAVRAELALVARAIERSANHIEVAVREKDWASAANWFKPDVDKEFAAELKAAPNEVPPEVALLAASLAKFKKAAARARIAFNDPLFDGNHVETSLQRTLTAIGLSPELLRLPGTPLNQSDAALLENATSVHLQTALESVRMLETGLATGADPDAALRLMHVSLSAASENMRNRPKSLGTKFRWRVKEIKTAYDPLTLKLIILYPDSKQVLYSNQVDLEQLLGMKP